MMLPLLFAMTQAASHGTARPAAPVDRRARCTALTKTDPKAAIVDATRWMAAGGGAAARECLGLAYSTQDRWSNAAAAFEDAAQTAAAAKDIDAASYAVEAGNAWLAGGDPQHARAALDVALASRGLTDGARGEALLDRARADVAAGQEAAARPDLDTALTLIPQDSLAWLLSATLARRMHDLPRAKSDIAEALKRAPHEAPVQLEAGNIAAMAGDEAGARAAWSQAVAIDPDGPVAVNARAALAQFDDPPVK